jgi:hypothetical protein
MDRRSFVAASSTVLLGTMLGGTSQSFGATGCHVPRRC